MNQLEQVQVSSKTGIINGPGLRDLEQSLFGAKINDNAVVFPKINFHLSKLPYLFGWLGTEINLQTLSVERKGIEEWKVVGNLEYNENVSVVIDIYNTKYRTGVVKFIFTPIVRFGMNFFEIHKRPTSEKISFVNYEIQKVKKDEKSPQVTGKGRVFKNEYLALSCAFMLWRINYKLIDFRDISLVIEAFNKATVNVKVLYVLGLLSKRLQKEFEIY